MTGTEPDLNATLRAAASAATQRVIRILLARQDSEGRWSGRSAGDVSLDAEAVLVREYLGIRSPEVTRAAAQQIRSMQQPDGNWIGGPARSGDLSASVLAYLALRLAGDSPDAYHLAVAAAWIRDAGGLAAAGLVTRGWLALFGLTGWDQLRVPGPELIYQPARYLPAAWTGSSRQMAISMAILAAVRPLRKLPVGLSELEPGGADSRGPGTRVPVSAFQRAALRSCGQWLVNWQQRAGLPATGRPYWALSLVALHALGYPLRHPALSGGLAWLDSVTARPRPPAGPGDSGSGLGGQTRLAVIRQPPVRDTAMAVRALADAGLPAGHPALVAAGSWLVAQQIAGPPDAAGLHLGAAPSGWSFGRDGYPVVADTADVLLALSRIELLAARPAVVAGVRWLTSAQRRDGSWAHSTATTAQVVQALAGRAAATHGAPDARAVRRGVVWLLRAQLADGSWPGGHGAGELQATTAVLTALLAAGVSADKPVVKAAAGWLAARREPDGGWSADPQPPVRTDSLSRLRSDPASTARVVAALLAAGGPAAAADAGTDWLLRAQRADGGWSDAADPATGKAAERNQPGRNPARRRGSLLPGILLPLAALGQYSACATVAPNAAQPGDHTVLVQQ